MKSVLKYIFLAISLFSSRFVSAQFNPAAICTIDNGKTIFTLNLNWSPDERKLLSSLFDLDSILISKVFAGEVKIISDSTVWQVKKLKGSIVELSTVIENKRFFGLKKNDVFIADDSWVNYTNDTRPIQVNYGVNNFKLKDIFKYENGTARFFLPGNKNAKSIYIAGSFNNWNTSEIRMQKCDSGWISKLKLPPGKYIYKYIIDGLWSLDVHNKLKEKDGKGNQNSVVFCSNYSFRLLERINAKKVILTGSFDNWHTNELSMNRTNDGWTLPIYLREGTYAYKFIVDGQWILDPANKITRPDGRGNINSYIGVGDAYTFQLPGFENAKKVILTGNFNGWNTEELELEKIGNTWKLDYILAPGMYEYKFIVDGNWITDPGNPFTQRSDHQLNSVIVFKANHTFRLDGYPGAKEVVVTGNFTRWNPGKYRMFFKDGSWILPCFLEPGKYIYKFVIDGKWILDPSNSVWEENEYNTGNSVLWVYQ